MKLHDYKSQEFLIMRFPAEEIGSNNNASGLYLGVAQFESLPGH
jgi:hypothetical protein